MIIFSLIATPVMVGTSLFKAGYCFAEQLETTMDGFDWMKNPVGKPIRNSATGIEADIHHLVEIRHHWDLAGEIVLDWEHDIVFPFGYFYDTMAGHYKIVLSPTTKDESLEGGSFLIGTAQDKDTAEMFVKMQWARFKGMKFQRPVVEQPEPLRQASL